MSRASPRVSPFSPDSHPVPATSTSTTRRASPGSKRAAVPAGMLSRMPKAGARSNAERAVDLEEVEVRAHLDGPVADVGHLELHHTAPDIGENVALAQDVLSGDHRPPPYRIG